MFSSVNISLIVLAWVFATLIRIAQGSATIAMLTAAGLMTAFVALADPALSQSQLALITCAIASGATGFSHVNDSGFWMISRYMGMNEKQTLKTWTLVSTAISWSASASSSSPGSSCSLRHPELGGTGTKWR